MKIVIILRVIIHSLQGYQNQTVLGDDDGGLGMLMRVLIGQSVMVMVTTRVVVVTMRCGTIFDIFLFVSKIILRYLRQNTRVGFADFDFF